MSDIKTSDGTSIEGVLQIPRVVFDEISFIRKGFKTGNPEHNFQYEQNIQKVEDGHYNVSLRVIVSKDEEYDATVQITGLCIINETDPNKDRMLKENAAAILFPYIRSELTLITAQPETDTLVLPVINISAMLKKAEMKTVGTSIVPQKPEDGFGRS